MPNTKIDWHPIYHEAWDECMDDFSSHTTEWLAFKLVNLMWRAGDERAHIRYDVSWLRKRLRWHHRVNKESNNHNTLEFYLARLLTSGWLKIAPDNTLYNPQTETDFLHACSKSDKCRRAAIERKNQNIRETSAQHPLDIRAASMQNPLEHSGNPLESTKDGSGRIADALHNSLPNTNTPLYPPKGDKKSRRRRTKRQADLLVGSNGSDPPTLTQEPHFCPACNLRQMSSACIRCKQPTIACGEL